MEKPAIEPSVDGDVDHFVIALDPIGAIKALP
jgi:hypothetical protein